MFLRRLRDQPHRWGASRICLFVTLFVFCGCGSIRVEQCQRRILGYGTDATWSPDGKNIAFLSQDQLCVVSADGRRGARNLTPDMSVCGFAWSPDSRSIAFGASTGLSRLGVEDDGLYWPRGSAGELGVVNEKAQAGQIRVYIRAKINRYVNAVGHRLGSSGSAPDVCGTAAAIGRSPCVSNCDAGAASARR